jgi:threonine dehydratase
VIELADVEAAAERLRGVVHRTPVLTSATLDRRVGARVFLKAECFQRTGSFKARGAYHAISRLPAARRAAGVVTMSSGNHAQAVAWAAGLFGVPAVVVMPTDAPAGKRAATEGYGAEVVTYDRYRQDRAAVAAALAAERGLTLVPPYDDHDVMAGQGTTALELIEEVGPLEVLLVPVGGGGLAAGCATAAKGRCPGVEVVGVEPAAGDDHRRSLAAGRRVRLPDVPRTVADGQAVQEPGELTFEVNRRRLDRVVTVADETIVAAVRFCFERLRIVVEPSGASALAALFALFDAGGGTAEGPAGELAGRRIGVVLSGGNIDADRFVALVGAP